MGVRVLFQKYDGNLSDSSPVSALPCQFCDELHPDGQRHEDKENLKQILLPG